MVYNEKPKIQLQYSNTLNTRLLTSGRYSIIYEIYTRNNYLFLNCKKNIVNKTQYILIYIYIYTHTFLNYIKNYGG